MKSKQQRKSKVEAVFCIIYARSTNRFLMELRSKYCNNPHTYGFFGGGLETDEDPLLAMRRELKEEIGRRVVEFDYTYPVNKKVQFFVKIFNNEFKPRLSWESQAYRWVSDLDDVQPLHPKIDKRYGEIRRIMQATRQAGAE